MGVFEIVLEGSLTVFVVAPTVERALALFRKHYEIGVPMIIRRVNDHETLAVLVDYEANKA